MNSAVEQDPAPRSLRARAQETQRAELARVACEMVDERGLESLSLRKLASRVGASTSVVYTLFGRKDGLLHATAQHALQNLSGPMASVPRGVLRDELEALARDSGAYRLTSTPERNLRGDPCDC